MTMPILILQLAIPTPLRRTFDYLSMINGEPVECRIGQRVKVSFGRREVIGVIVGITNQSEFPIEKLKPILERVDDFPIITEQQLQIVQWASDYYCHPIGEVMLGALPKKLRLGKEAILSKISEKKRAKIISENFELTSEQKNAIDQITECLSNNQSPERERGGVIKKFQTFLLFGVTGSGKTEVYLQVIEKCIANQKQALVLVPEIALTPQTVSRFASRFSVPVILLHSGLTDRVRLNAWLQATTNDPCIVIGTRSAVFAPLKNLGVIVVDEEHDTSFKQQSGFRYSARDVAVMLGKLSDVPVILGSATPSLESFYNAKQKKYTLLQLTHRPGHVCLPRVEIHDLRKIKLKNGLSPRLLDVMKTHLDQSNQVILFLNRRGYAPVLICHHCGWTAGCAHCDAKLTVHHNPNRLLCHHCGFQKKMIRVCESCEQCEVIVLGLGTEQLEKTLADVFPTKRILRIDRDSMRSFSSLEKALTSVREREVDIIIGTQMLIKGHHFEHVTLVGAIDIDRGLFSTDFRAIERLGQSLTQVAGRAGRGEKKGEVFIQTHQPNHSYLKMIFEKDYLYFSDAVLNERLQMHLPPRTHLLLLRAEAKDKKRAIAFLTRSQQQFLKYKNMIEVSDPLPSLLERKAGVYRANIWIQSMNRLTLKNAVNDFLRLVESSKEKVRWMLDVDPVEL